MSKKNIKDFEDPIIVVTETDDPIPAGKKQNHVTTKQPKMKRCVSVSCKKVFILMIVVTFMVCYFFSTRVLQDYMTKFEYDRYWYMLNVTPWPCVLPADKLQNMSKFAVDASSALEQLGAKPVACFGTLLGALRLGKTLPWDSNVDLCVLNRISNDFEEIQRVFWTFDIQIDPYDSWNGHFNMSRDGMEGFIIVYSDCTLLDSIRFYGHSGLIEYESTKGTETSLNSAKKWLCPDGKLPYLSQLFKAHTKPIPSSLLTPPFISLPFGKNASIAIPNGDTAILHSLYPDSWWLEIKPLGCR